MPERYVLKEGECVASVAYTHGFFPDTVWLAKENAELRKRRRDGYTLAPGDELVIPDKRRKDLPAVTGRRHVFRRRGVPERFQVRLLDAAGRPRSGLICVLVIDGVRSSVTSDADGWIRAFISPLAQVVEVRIGTSEHYSLQLGKLPPFDTIAGMQARLKNLAYDCGDDGPAILGVGTRDALAHFLRDSGAEPPAVWNDAALASAADAIRERYGC